MYSLKKHKGLRVISREWDQIAPLREKQIQTGSDHSANFVLAPAILGAMPSGSSVIDIGCGTGWLTSRAAELSKNVVGIDPSKISIVIAESEYTGANFSFSALSVEQYSVLGKKFDVAISNMAASSAPDLASFLKSSRKLLKTRGAYIITIPHPCFWPQYWGYANDPSFKYDKTFAVEGNFKIRDESSNFITTHFHHPLNKYIELLSKSGFQLNSILELTGKGFPFPRFLLMKSYAI
jgi:2-polyprenyl-3-methyl-5-hydroxy-6-metoxy-1,4-benzoquinol methylase